MKTADHLPIDPDYEPVRRPDGRFGPGNCANPIGRPKGSVGGRQRALMILDEIVNDPSNVEALRQAMVNAFIEDPMKFFRQIIMPLLPSEAVHKIQQEPTTVRWVSIMESVRMREAAEKASTADDHRP